MTTQLSLQEKAEIKREFLKALNTNIELQWTTHTHAKTSYGNYPPEDTKTEHSQTIKCVIRAIRATDVAWLGVGGIRTSDVILYFDSSVDLSNMPELRFFYNGIEYSPEIEKPTQAELATVELGNDWLCQMLLIRRKK